MLRWESKQHKCWSLPTLACISSNSYSQQESSYMHLSHKDTWTKGVNQTFFGHLHVDTNKYYVIEHISFCAYCAQGNRRCLRSHVLDNNHTCSTHLLVHTHTPLLSSFPWHHHDQDCLLQSSQIYMYMYSKWQASPPSPRIIFNSDVFLCPGAILALFRLNR